VIRAFLYVCVEIQSLYSDKPLTTNLKNKDTFGNIISVPKGAGKETLPRCGTIQNLFNEVNELLGSSPFSDVSFLLKVCRHAQNYTKFGNKSVSGCCKDTPFQKECEKA